MLERVKNQPGKLWKDWKMFRNHPGLEYRDEYDVLPSSYYDRFPSPGYSTLL